MVPLTPLGFRWLKSPHSQSPPPSAEPPSGKICTWPWAVLGAIVVAGMTLFYHLDSYRTFSSHEIYAVVPAREMMESGNWVFPTFGHLPRLRKPPLAYWIVAGSATAFGELSPFSARLPSAAAGLLLAGLMGLWAGRWYGPRVGWAAVFVQLTSAWFLIFARKAEIDIVLCLFTTSAMFLIADQPGSEGRTRSFLRWLGVYGLLSLAWLAKFHYGAAMVLAPVVLYFSIEHRRDRLKQLLHPLGLLIFAGAVLIWPMLVLEYAPNAWEVWRRETLGRAVGEMGTHPIHYYMPFLIWLPMPWTPFVIAAIPKSWKSAWSGRDAREKFLWVWLLVQLAIVTISANKHKNYLLATMPVFTLLAARSLSAVLHGIREGRVQIPKRWVGRLIAMNLLGSLLLLVLLPRKWPELAVPAAVLAATIGLCGAAGWLLLSRRRVFAVMVFNIVNLVVVGVVVIDGIVPHCDRRVHVKAFAEDIRRNVLPEEPVCVFRMDRDPLVYHLGSPVFRVERIQDLRSRINAGRPLYVLGYERTLRNLGQFAETSPVARLPKGKKGREPVEGNVVLVKLESRRLSSANAN